MLCAKCGKKINDDSTFCPHCGQKVNTKIEVEKPSKMGTHYFKSWYVGIFVILVIILILVFALKNKEVDTAIYMPGVYTSSFILNDNAVDIEVTVDDKSIISIRMINFGEAESVMYPLIEPTFESLISQIYEKQSLDDITFSDDNKNTSMILLDVIKESLQKAEEAANNT